MGNRQNKILRDNCYRRIGGVQGMDLLQDLMQMKIYILLVAVILVQSQLPQQQPPKFGLLTVTHARDNNFDTLLNYLKHYAQTQCYEDLISEICIVWNNHKTPQEVGALQEQLFWRVPVYFYYTKNNSLNHRFRIPKQANADVFYSLDDDILVDCETLNQTFLKYWYKKQAYPNRFVSNQVRSFGYMLHKKTEFFYQGHSYAQYFAIAETGATFFPKHYLELYYLAIQQLQKLRNRVENITSCQDIFFMAIAQHFYPEMIPQYYPPSKDYKNTDPKVGLSRKRGLVELRTSCFTFLVDTFGYNPLRQFSKNVSKYADNWRFNNIDIIMQTKIRGFGDVKLVVGQEREEQRVDKQPSPFLAPQEKAQFQYNDENDEQKSQQNTYKIASQQQQSQIQVKNDLKFNTKPQIQAEKKSVEIAEQQQSKESWIMANKFQLLVFLLVFVIVGLIICMIRLIKMYRQLKKMNNLKNNLAQIRQQQQDPMRNSY